MTRKEIWKPISLGLLLGALISYALVAMNLGLDPRTWRPQISLQQIEAQRAEYDRVCSTRRP